MIKKIMIALDYSETTTRVFRKGQELAASLGAGVILLHVLSETTQYSYLNYSPILGFDSSSNLDVVQTNTIEEVEKAADQFLNRFREEIGIDDTRTVLKKGDFAEEILNTAEEEGIDLIVVGSHGRRGLDKILMGSVAEKVLRKSEVPVLIVPVRKKQE